MCKECGGKGKHTEESSEPPNKIFKHFPPFPKEGILGMYPIPSTCKKEIAEHMAKFQAKLMEKCKMPDVKVRMRENVKGRDDEDDRTALVEDLLEKLDMEIGKLKHDLAVEMIKKKYEKNDVEKCACARIP